MMTKEAAWHPRRKKRELEGSDSVTASSALDSEDQADANAD